MNSISEAATGSESAPGASDDPASYLSKSTRKELLERYDHLTREIKEQTSEANKGAASKIVLDHLGELNSLYESLQRDKFKDTRTHLMDSQALREIASFAANNAKNIKIGMSDLSLSSAEITSMLKQYMGSGVATDGGSMEEYEELRPLVRSEQTFNSHNWLKLGALYYQTSRKTVSSDFLYGPLATERRRQAARTVTMDDTKTASSSTAQQVQANEVSENEEQNTAHMVRLVYQIIMENLNEGESINFFNLFINPQSFTQSVENLFFTSFLIKDARLSLYLENDIPYVKLPSIEERETARLAPSSSNTTHHISTLNYGTWQAIIDTFGITSPFLGHRDEPEDSVPEDL